MAEYGTRTVTQPWTEGLAEAANMIIEARRGAETRKRQKLLDAYNILSKNAEIFGFTTPENAQKLSVLSNALLEDIPGMKLPEAEAGGVAVPPSPTSIDPVPKTISPPNQFLQMLGQMQGQEGAINAPVSQGPTGLPATSLADLKRTRETVGAMVPPTSNMEIRPFADYFNEVESEMKRAYSVPDTASLSAKNRSEIMKEAQQRRSKDVQDVEIRQRSIESDVINARRQMAIAKMNQESATERAAQTATARDNRYFAIKEKMELGKPVTIEESAFIKIYEEKTLLSARGTLEMNMGFADIPSLAEAIGDNRESIEGVKQTNRAPVAAAAQSEVLKKYPKFNFNKSDAVRRYLLIPANLRSMGLANAVYPRMQDLEEKAKVLANFGPPALNTPFNKLKKQLGGKRAEAVADYESLRNAIIQETNTALTGSSTASDYRIQIELENLQSGYTLGMQLKSIGNLRSALDARVAASTESPYSVPEVRGYINFAGKDAVQDRRQFNYWYELASINSPDETPQSLVNFYMKNYYGRKWKP